MRKKKNSHVWEKHPEDWYVEEEWCARRLFERVTFAGDIHDPCCGMGTIPLAAAQKGYAVTCSDIKDRMQQDRDGLGFMVRDYRDDPHCYDSIVTNPPFSDINKKPWPFIEWVMSHTVHQAALLVPFKWFGGDKRSRYLESLPLTAIYVMTPRPSMPPGPALLEMWKNGEEPGGGLVDFAWAIFTPSSAKLRRAAPIVRWLHRDG